MNYEALQSIADSVLVSSESCQGRQAAAIANESLLILQSLSFPLMPRQLLHFAL